MRIFLIICLIFNAMSQGNQIDRLLIKISTIEHEKNTMQNKIKELEEDITILERRKNK